MDAFVEFGVITPLPQRDEFDLVLEDALARDPKIERWIYSKIAGVSHRNDDGSSRQEELAQCEALEQLILKWEPLNPVDNQAVAVFRARSAVQLGYLNKRLAHDTLKRVRDGEKWGALFARKRGGTQDRPTIGTSIVLIKLKENL